MVAIIASHWMDPASYYPEQILGHADMIKIAINYSTTGRDKMYAISQTTFQAHFLELKYLNSD